MENIMIIFFSVLVCIGIVAFLWITADLRSCLYPEGDPRADTEQDPVYIDNDRVAWYPEWECPDDPSWADMDRCEYIFAWLEIEDLKRGE